MNVCTDGWRRGTNCKGHRLEKHQMSAVDAVRDTSSAALPLTSSCFQQLLMWKEKCNGGSTRVSQSTHVKEGFLSFPLLDENETLTKELTHWTLRRLLEHRRKTAVLEFFLFYTDYFVLHATEKESPKPWRCPLWKPSSPAPALRPAVAHLSCC